MPPHVRREFFGPFDNFPLSRRDFAKACGLCDVMLAMRDDRMAYIEQRGLDPRVHLPAHMWDQDFVSSNFRKITRKDYHTLNHLRCLTYNFTGFSMLTMAPVENEPELMEVPQDADAIIRSVAGRAASAAVGFARATADMPRQRIVEAPRMFGESGWDLDGSIVNFDNWAMQQRINGLHCSGVLDFLQQRAAERGRARVLEIGAGYGDLAYNLNRMVGPLDYFVVDLPDSMVYSSIYLSTVVPESRVSIAQPGVSLAEASPGFTFIGNHMIAEFLPQIGEVDLVVNVMSLSEMSPLQVSHYGRCVSKLIGARGVFYEQNYMQPGVQTNILPVLGGEFAYGALLAETKSPHRGRGMARMWANNYRRELWNRGGLDWLETDLEPTAVVVPQLRPRAEAAKQPAPAAP